jgi:hypothetical protein
MSGCQEIVLRVPLQFVLPDFYEKANQEKTSLALRMGALAVQTLFSSIAEEVREECNSDLVTQLEKKHLKKQEVLEKDKRLLEETMNHLQARLGTDEQLKGDWQRQIREESRSLYKELLAEKDKQITQLAQFRDQLTGEMRTLQEKMQQVTAAAARQLGSQEKGKAGEVSMEEIIKKAYGSASDFELTMKGREAQSGDYHMEYNKSRFLWEVKNYTRMVNKDEVEKLHRDMRANPDAKLGIMVSLHSGVTGHTKSGDIDLEYLEDGRSILYLSNLYKREDPVFYLQTLRPYFDSMEQKKEVKESLDSEEIVKLKSRANVVQHLLRSHTQTLQGLHNSIVQQKRRSDTVYAEQIAFIQQANGECKNTLKNLVSDDMAESPLETSLNPTIYKIQNLVEMSEPQQKFVKWIQENCEEDLSHEMEAKLFQEKFKHLFKSERELKGARDILQESVWKSGGKKVKGLRIKI